MFGKMVCVRKKRCGSMNGKMALGNPPATGIANAADQVCGKQVVNRLTEAAKKLNQVVYNAAQTGGNG